MTDPGHLSIRQLICELVSIEDKIRETPTLLGRGNPASPDRVNPDLLALFKREGEVTTALRHQRRALR